jgi:hypothetical protein
MEQDNNKNSTTAYNRPHQPMIHYSAKGYDEYRADLMKRLEKNGFVLRDDDFVNAFVDLTAYLGEVLMTYQNAYAQEIYLETAQLRESLFSLAYMVDYHINPGAAALGLLVVKAKNGKNGILPKGFLVSGKEENAKQSVFFETNADLNVDEKFNDFALVEKERFNSIYLNHNTPSSKITVKEKITVIPGQYIYFHSDLLGMYYFAQVQSSTFDEENRTVISFVKLYASTLTSSKIEISKEAVMKSEISKFLKPENILSENKGHFLFVNRHKVIGDRIPSMFKIEDGRWGLIRNEPCGVLKLENNQGRNKSYVWLDGKYEGIEAEAPIVFRHESAINYGIVTELGFETVKIKIAVSIADQKDILESREVSKINVSWLNSAPVEHQLNPTEKSSTHIVFVGIQTPLKAETKSKNTDSLKGQNTLKVDGDFSKLEKYRALILHEDEEISGVKTTEEASVLEVSYDQASKTSAINLKNSISKGFTKHGVKIWGNVAKITQGKTMPETILGSGRGEESYQTFDLPQSPLTFESRGREGLKGAIDIKVSDLIWQQKDDFLNSGSEDFHYIIETDFEGKSRVVFGDGTNGNRLPTGRDNVTAKFRTGQGTSGNVSEGVLKKPLSKPSFLSEVLNPLKTAGGTDPDKEVELRKKMPVEHITFDRAVSLQDYANLALAYPGIAKAKAGWRWLNNKQYVFLAVAGSEGKDITLILENLRAYLDARRDVNQPLIVKQVDAVPIKLSVSVIASADYEKEKVEDALYKALGKGVNEDGTLQFFNFDRLDIGMSIHKKDVYKAVENIKGVELITKLEITRSSISGSPCVEEEYFKPSSCSEDVWINNWELAEIAQLDIVVSPSPVNKICERSGG